MQKTSLCFLTSCYAEASIVSRQKRLKVKNDLILPIKIILRKIKSTIKSAGKIGEK